MISKEMESGSSWGHFTIVYSSKLKSFTRNVKTESKD